MHDAEDEDPSAAIQHWLQERKKGQLPFQPKRQVKKKTKTPQNITQSNY